MWPAVELRELQVFLAVAEELHFGRAAERLDVNPSRVSQIIRQLETKVGGRLFDRTSRRVRLAPLGERLRDNVAPSYEQLRLGIADAREVAAGVAGTLRIGSYHLTLNGGPHMLEIVRMFKARHPGCEVEFVDTGFPASVVDVLKAGEVDMLCLRLPLTSARSRSAPSSRARNGSCWSQMATRSPTATRSATRRSPTASSLTIVRSRQRCGRSSTRSSRRLPPAAGSSSGSRTRASKTR